MRVIITAHAWQRMGERGVIYADMIRTIRRGRTHTQKPNKLVASYSCYQVVYAIRNRRIYVITVKIL